MPDEMKRTPRVAVCTYKADCARGNGRERALCVLLTSPDDLLQQNDNPVLDALAATGLARSNGVYFYRFATPATPFLKIGECMNPKGISQRFRRGWHGTPTYGDTYLGKMNGGLHVESGFLAAVKRISDQNRAYFVFYEHLKIASFPKVDELFALRMHKRLFGRGTACKERVNTSGLLGRRLIWHKGAFPEVVRAVLPNGESYPR